MVNPECGTLVCRLSNSLGNLLALGAIVLGYTIIAVIIAFCRSHDKITEFNVGCWNRSLTGQGIFCICGYCINFNYTLLWGFGSPQPQ